MNDLLNQYSANGLPALPSLIQIGQSRFDDNTFKIEADWREIVANSQVRHEERGILTIKQMLCYLDHIVRLCGGTNLKIKNDLSIFSRILSKEIYYKMHFFS